MPNVSFGPRTQRVYTALRDRIARGELAAGAKLPPHIELATEYGIAPLTMRQVLVQLEEEGLVTREHGRGTFVTPRAVATVLIVESDPAMAALLREDVTRAGYRAILASTSQEATASMEEEPALALVFCNVRLPDKESGHRLIRAVRRRFPALPLVVVTGHPEDLDGLHGTPECPVLMLPRPFWPHQIEETLRLTLRP
jgi:DNA-binding transcriptional regulator YhcF (GntR family)